MSLSRRCGESVDGNGQAPSEAGPPFVPAEARSVRSHPSRQEVSPPGAPAPPPPLESARPSPELPYPEAPLASRKADFKKPPRYIAPEVLRAFHDTQPDCLTCGYYRVSAHHLVSRAQGGDDVPANLIPLCGMCHGCLHSGGKAQAYGITVTQEGVRNRIGAFLTSEAGEDHLNYVKTKLGTGAAAFLSKYGVED